MITNHNHMMPHLFEAIVCLQEHKAWQDVDLAQDMAAGLKDIILDHDYGEVAASKTINPDNFNDTGASDG
jgi:hypothetical protein